MSRTKVISVAVVLALCAGLFGFAVPAFASARTASWVVSVTYQNVGANPASVTVDFYPEGSGTPINFNPLGAGTLGPGAGASLYIGSVTGLPTPFRGSAVMSSSEPLVATVVQFSQDAGFKMRMLSNGFSATDASNQYLIATTLLQKFSRTTVFSIQNSDTADVKATVKFYDADNAGALAGQATHVIPVGSSKYIEMDNAATTGLPGTTTVFNGSAIVTAVRNSDNTTPAKVVAAASELYTNKNVGGNFEGVPLSRASNTIYLATALCQRFGLDTFYAVQNASLTDAATVTVTYYDTSGVLKTTDGPYPIGPGQKKSISTCAPSSGVSMASFTGSAKITSTGAPIVALGKAQAQVGAGAATADVFTIFMGEPQGASKLALPFVRWANDTNFNAPTNMGGKQRAFLAIQNLETTTIKVNVKYFGKAGGAPIATEQLTIPGLSKGSSNASTAGALGAAGMNAGEFGYYTDGSFGGAVTIEADATNPTAKFIAIARVQHPGAGEDYNAVPVP
jgi:hypothetical protein